MKSVLKIKFLKNILILSSLIAIGLPLFVILLIFPLFHELLTKNTENMAISIARHLSSDVIGNQDLLSRDFLTDETLSDIQKSVNQFGLMKLKILSESGEIIFSTAPKDIGKLNKKTYFHDFVAKGNVYTTVVKKGTKSLEDQIVTEDVVETYIPIIKNDKFIGAFEIYYNITDRKERLEKLLHTSSLVLSLMAISLQGTIIISLFKVSKNIVEREKAEEQRDQFILKLQAALTRVETLSAISQTVNKTLNLDQVLNDALDVVMDKFKPHSITIRLLDNQTQEMVIVAHKGLTPEDLKKLAMRKKIEKTVSSHAIKSLEAVVIEDILTDPRAEGKDSFTIKVGCRSLVTLILCAKDKMVGNMAIRFLETRDYTDEETRHFTSIGHQIGTAIENARLYLEKEVTIKKLSETQKKLQQAQTMQAIGTLAGGIAHDFNNILSAIIGYTELALMKSKGHVIQEYLLKVLIASGRATDLVRQILTFSRQGGKVENKPLQVKLIVKEVLKLLRPSLPTTIEIYENIHSDSLVLADPTQIHQILMNLCTNAAHAMREGGILEVGLADLSLDSAFTSKHPEIEPGLFIRLIISDTGHGMTPDVLNQIFDPFFTTKASGEGTGMGLAVVHGIVKSHGGAITVYSEPEKGTTFNVFFPVIKREAQEETRIEETLPTGTERILFVDDDLPLVSIGKDILESLGYQVESRTSSIEALELFKAMPEKFDLVITDMTMPNLRGDQLAKQLMEVRPDIPVILCTGFSPEINEEKSQSIGIRAFVFKPLLKYDMAKTIRKVLDEAKRKADC